ncbi:hypothetical protein Ssi02_23630 [Sinosporangium siamense]|uniref:Uncharacterized protein n=1 Tax=Sinosporangium siamense TaxID=1367973 RepID=A0A919V7I8_9ACTN|nr:hypothetical protein Ssi02_23630 [Sinosporangium siamense]
MIALPNPLQPPVSGELTATGLVVSEPEDGGETAKVAENLVDNAEARPLGVGRASG